MVSFCAVLFPLEVLDEIWDVIESVSKEFLTYSSKLYEQNYVELACHLTILLKV